MCKRLQNTSLDVARGELHCLIGPSGCGKSTLLSVIGGLTTPTTGTVTVAGKPVRGPMPRDLAFVFQENALFPWNTVFENIVLGMKFQGVPKSERNERARRALEAVGLDGFAEHFPGQLSGGMRQRAALARALSLETDILLMDEPFGALDEQTRMVLGEDLSVLLSRSRKTIVFVTHSLGEAVFLADRVAVFSARPGSIKEIITIDEPHPRKPSFMTAPKFHALRDRLYGLLHDEIRKIHLGNRAAAAALRRSGQSRRRRRMNDDAREPFAIRLASHLRASCLCRWPPDPVVSRDQCVGRQQHLAAEPDQCLASAGRRDPHRPIHSAIFGSRSANCSPPSPSRRCSASRSAISSAARRISSKSSNRCSPPSMRSRSSCSCRSTC